MQNIAEPFFHFGGLILYGTAEKIFNSRASLSPVQSGNRESEAFFQRRGVSGLDENVPGGDAALST